VVRPGIAAAIRRLSELAIVSGLVIVLAALVWWARFYGPIGLGATVACLYARSGTCDFIRHVAAEAGRVAYSPTLFRLGAVSLAGGVVARLAVALLRSAGAGQPKRDARGDADAKR
jgi:hypothetical protein